MSVIDELYETAMKNELSFELDENLKDCVSLKHIPDINPPDHLDPVLRPYQRSGFQWLSYLNDVTWGGILADDMGLVNHTGINYAGAL